METDTPETDAEAWFDNDEGWWVSRSVSRRLERGRRCAMDQVAWHEKELMAAKAIIADQQLQLRAYEKTLDGLNVDQSEGN